MTNWKPIESAPKDGTIIDVTTHNHGIYAMCWDKKLKKWTGEYYSSMGKRKIYWDESVEKITHWREIT